MKNLQHILFIFPLAALMISWGFLTKSTVDLSHYSTHGLELYYDVPFEITFEVDEDYIIYPYLGKSFVGFREALAFRESRGDYFIINDFGYMGKYQFGRSTLHLIGIRDTERFLNDPILQESAFKAYA